LSSRLLSGNVKFRIYETVISPIVLYGCEAWCPTLREDHRLRIFENQGTEENILTKRDEIVVVELWRKLHNEEPHNLYSSPNIVRMIESRRMRWAGHVARRGTKSIAQGCW
jgi:hypothetical protein